MKIISGLPRSLWSVSPPPMRSTGSSANLTLVFRFPSLTPPPFYYLEELMSFFKHLYHRILCQDCSLHTNKAKSIIALIVLITPIHSDNSFNTYLGTFFSSRVLTNLRLLDNLLVQERQLLQCIGLLGLPLPLPLP